MVTWQEALKNVGKAFAVGGLTGATGQVMRNFLAAAGIAPGSVHYEGLSAFAGGLNAGIGFLSGAAIDGRLDELRTPAGVIGAAVAAGIGAFLGGGKGWVRTAGWDDASPDLALKLAGTPGQGLAMTAWEATESVIGWLDRLGGE